MALCDLLQEPDFRQLADVDTPSGHLEESQGEALSSSVAERDVSAFRISDVSAISSVLEMTTTFTCAECNMVCKSVVSLNKHKVEQLFSTLFDSHLILRGARTARISNEKTQQAWMTRGVVSAVGSSPHHKL